MAADEPRVVDNADELQYELWVGGKRVGFVAYRREPGVVVLIHTDVDPACEGQGLGSRLVAGALGDLRRHPEDGDLVVEDPAVSD
jgi:predicted GNAT family acetyltransferase